MIQIRTIFIFLFIHSSICYIDKQVSLFDDLKKLGKRNHFFFFVFLNLFFFHQLGDSIICPSDLFRCDTIQCLPYAFVCNGEYNCQDKTDEMNCSTAIINNDLCNTKNSINCEQDILHSTRLADHGIKFEYTRPVQICIKR
jgi:hypothetical protein